MAPCSRNSRFQLVAFRSVLAIAHPRRTGSLLGHYPAGPGEPPYSRGGTVSGSMTTIPVPEKATPATMFPVTVVPNLGSNSVLGEVAYRSSAQRFTYMYRGKRLNTQIAD
jgi:hypothetical protein